MVDNSYYGIKDAVSCARFAELQEADRKALEAAKAEEERKEQEKKDQKLADYYNNLKEEYKDYLKKDN